MRKTALSVSEKITALNINQLRKEAIKKTACKKVKARVTRWSGEIRTSSFLYFFNS